VIYILKESFYQQGLPKILKNKAKAIKRNTLRLLAWKYADIHSLFEWLKDNDLIVNSIDVYEINNGTPVIRLDSWFYEGDHISSFENSKQKNRLGALEFIKDAEATKNKELVFPVFFESTKEWDHLKIEFFNREINSAGVVAYLAEDGLDLIDRCYQDGRSIKAIEAFIINKRFIQPQDFISYSPDSYDRIDPDIYFKIYHIKKYTDAGHWEEAKEYIRNGGLRGWVFDIDYEKK
jgi:hypothetical protein